MSTSSSEECDMDFYPEFENTVSTGTYYGSLKSQGDTFLKGYRYKDALKYYELVREKQNDMDNSISANDSFLLKRNLKSRIGWRRGK